MKHTWILAGCVTGLALMLFAGGCNRSCVLAEPLSCIPCGLCTYCWTQAPPCPTAVPPECKECPCCPVCCKCECPCKKKDPCTCNPCAPCGTCDPCCNPCTPCTCNPCAPCCTTCLADVVTAAVDSALASKGYVKGTQAGCAPTFLVSQQSWLARVCNGRSVDPPMGCCGGVYANYSLDPKYGMKEKAKVIIEFRRAANCPPFWRGMATVNLCEDEDACERAEHVRAAVEKVVKKFPNRCDIRR